MERTGDIFFNDGDQPLHNYQHSSAKVFTNRIAGWLLHCGVAAYHDHPVININTYIAGVVPVCGYCIRSRQGKRVKCCKTVVSTHCCNYGGAALILWLFGPMVIVLFYGPKFEPTVAVFRILAFVPMIIGLSNLLGIQTMINLKMDKTFFRDNGFGRACQYCPEFYTGNPIRFYRNSMVLAAYKNYLLHASMYVVLARKGINIIQRKYFTVSHFGKYLRPIILTVKQKINK